MHLCTRDPEEVRQTPLDFGARLAPQQQDRHLELRGPLGDVPSLVAQVRVESVHGARDSQSSLVSIGVVSFIEVVDEPDALLGHELFVLVERFERRPGPLDGALGILVPAGRVDIRGAFG